VIIIVPGPDLLHFDGNLFIYYSVCPPAINCSTLKEQHLLSISKHPTVGADGNSTGEAFRGLAPIYIQYRTVQGFTPPQGSTCNQVVHRIHGSCKHHTTTIAITTHRTQQTYHSISIIHNNNQSPPHPSPKSQNGPPPLNTLPIPNKPRDRHLPHDTGRIHHEQEPRLRGAVHPTRSGRRGISESTEVYQGYSEET